MFTSQLVPPNPTRGTKQHTIQNVLHISIIKCRMCKHDSHRHIPHLPEYDENGSPACTPSWGKSCVHITQALDLSHLGCYNVLLGKQFLYCIGSHSLNLCGQADEGVTIFQNLGNYLPNNTWTRGRNAFLTNLPNRQAQW